MVSLLGTVIWYDWHTHKQEKNGKGWGKELGLEQIVVGFVSNTENLELYVKALGHVPEIQVN
jgi:hypothetical protein